MSTSGGVLSLPKLLASMSPVLDEEKTYVFATVKQNPFSTILDRDQPGDFEAFIKEAEGWTVIARRQHAEKLALAYEFPCAKITLNVHSSLDAVGFLAAITSRLAKDLQIGVNPVSGFYHDHLFVPSGRERDVLGVLRTMVKEAKAQAPNE